MGNAVRTRLTAALCLLFALSAAARGGTPDTGTSAAPGPSALRPPRPAASLGASFSYSAPAGLISRRTGVSGETALGSAAGFSLRAAADLAHLRNIATGDFPGELYRAGLKLTAERGETRLALNLNSNSDRPFHSPSETDLGLNFTALLSDNNGSAWLWGLNYSTRRSFLRGMPLPFITYRYTSKNLMVALPFIIRWQAGRTLAFSASYVPVKYFKAGLSWRPRPFFRAELEGGTVLEQFLPAGRNDKGRALFYEASSVSLKPTLAFSRNFELTPSLGWQFGGLYYTGGRYDEYIAKTRLRGGPSFALSTKYSF